MITRTQTWAPGCGRPPRGAFDAGALCRYHGRLIDGLIRSASHGAAKRLGHAKLCEIDCALLWSWGVGALLIGSVRLNHRKVLLLVDAWLKPALPRQSCRAAARSSA